MKSAQLKTSTLRRHQSRRVATESVMSATRLARRVGFTLVELLMVIVIIGILVGMLAVAINPVLERTRETAVTTEMKQIEMAIESFKNKYGFYPPSFVNITTAAGVLPYLNKMSPNHREGNGAVGTRLNAWWTAVGQHLDTETSLVFWLSGLGKNKQFPLTFGLMNVDSSGQAVSTGGDFQIPSAYNINRQANGAFLTALDGGTQIQLNPEREVFFDFNGRQLVEGRTGGMQKTFTDASPTASPPNFTIVETAIQPGLALYNMAHGNEKGIINYVYRNSGDYAMNFSFTVSGQDAGGDGVLDAGDSFYNPRTFQLGTNGLDGKGVATTHPQSGKYNGDNMVNFASGRLDNFLEK